MIQLSQLFIKPKIFVLIRITFYMILIVCGHLQVPLFLNVMRICMENTGLVLSTHLGQL